MKWLAVLLGALIGSIARTIQAKDATGKVFLLNFILAVTASAIMLPIVDTMIPSLSEDTAIFKLFGITVIISLYANVFIRKQMDFLMSLIGGKGEKQSKNKDSPPEEGDEKLEASHASPPRRSSTEASPSVNKKGNNDYETLVSFVESGHGEKIFCMLGKSGLKALRICIEGEETKPGHSIDNYNSSAFRYIKYLGLIESVKLENGSICHRATLLGHRTYNLIKKFGTKNKDRTL